MLLIRKNQSGIALFLTLAVLTLISVIGFGLVAISRTNLRVISNNSNYNQAYYLAVIGIAKARNELRENYWWGTDEEKTFSADNGTYTVSIWAPSSNTDSFEKKWKVTSIGKIDGSKRKLTAWLESESFSKYAYFTEQESTPYQTIWMTDRDKIKGRVHTNGYFSIYSTPQFSDEVTSHNNSDSFYDAVSRLYTTGAVINSDPSKFYHYYTSYKNDIPVALDDSKDFSFTGGFSELYLPADTGKVADKADNKIYQDADVKFLNTGNVEVTTKETYSYWVRERRDRSWVWTQRQSVKTETITLPTANLTLYIGGTVHIKGGEVKGKVTLATEGSIYIDNSITYNDENRDVLGIISEKDIIVNTDPYTKKDIKIDALLMAINGSFYVYNYNYGIYRGTLKILGGLVQYSRGPVGTFNSDTGLVITGYNKDYNYDNKLKNIPPPNFPTTGNIILLSVQDSAALNN